VSTCPKFAQGFVKLGKVHEKLGEIREAIECFYTAIKLGDKSESTVNLLKRLQNYKA